MQILFFLPDFFYDFDYTVSYGFMLFCFCYVFAGCEIIFYFVFPQPAIFCFSKNVSFPDSYPGINYDCP